jgi:DNA processing protein
MAQSKQATKSAHLSRHVTKATALPDHNIPQGWLNELALWHLVNHALATWRSLLAHYGSAEVAIQAKPADWQALGAHASHVKRLSEWHAGGKVKQRYEQTLAGLAHGDYQLLYEASLEYPSLLATIPDSPPILFYRGDLSHLSQPQLAMVGTRKPTPSARKIAFDFARDLAAQGVWVTSGLAYGIDADSHKGALAAGGGRTIAVLGTGVDVCYPASHQPLYDQILAEGGLLLSEFLPGTEPMAHHFPRRNRIVSGLSLGVLVVEAALQSGTLITARLAAEQGRDVLVLPGHIANAQAAGCHQLIRDGARLVTSVADILEDLNLAHTLLMPQTTAAQLPATDSAIPAHLQDLHAALDWNGQSIDCLIDSTGLDIASLSSQLMELELLGFAVQASGRYLRSEP